MERVLEMEDKIVLFSFRKKHTSFFHELLENCSSQNLTIVSSKNIFSFSFKALKYIRNIDTIKACEFAYKEFYAKTNIQIPLVFLKVYFKSLANINFLRYYALLDNNYSKMLLWNGGKFRHLIALEVAKLHHIKVYYYENGLLPNTVVFDKKGINASNSVPRNKSFYENYHTSIELPGKLVPRIGRNRDIFKGIKKDLPKEYIFVPFQVDADTQILISSPWIKNMRILFDTIESISNQCKYSFVFKEHPSSGVVYADLHERIKQSSNLSFQNEYSTQELIENSQAVVTINSTVGIESLLFYKKVIILGDAFYNIEGLTFSANNKDELEKKIYSLDILDIDKTLINNFLKYLYNEYLIKNDEEVYRKIYKRLVENEI